jgi:uncharacterized damage-inducible protein DinB
MTMARAWLAYLRKSAISKLDGLDDAERRWTPASTANSLGVILVHLGYAERLWFRAIFAGEPMDMSWRQHMFELPDGWTRDDIVAFYEAETAAADTVLDGATSLDLPSAAAFRPTTLRWVVTHLIEETARHAGHGHHPRARRRHHRPLNGAGVTRTLRQLRSNRHRAVASAPVRSVDKA